MRFIRESSGPILGISTTATIGGEVVILDWPVSRETSKEGGLCGYSYPAWEEIGRRTSLHQDFEGSTMADPSKYLETEDSQLPRVPPRFTLVHGGFRHDEQSTHLEKARRTLGSDRR